MTMDALAEALRGKEVLVTGGLGFIGSNLAYHCHRLGARVTVYDSLDPRSGGNLHNIAEFQDDIQIVVDDMRNLAGISQAVRRKDIVFNCAAFTSHPSSMREPLTDIQVNCEGVVNLLEALRRFSPQARLVHVGTSTQTGPMLVEPIDEHHPEFPLDIYSANKTASEKYVLIYGHAYDLPVSVIRLANVYGPRSNIRSSDFGFINYFIGLALMDRDITVYGSGAQRRNVTYVEDGVAALLQAAVDERAIGQVFFAVSDDHLAVAGVAEAICRVFGRGRVRQVEWSRERRAIEVGDAIISNARIRAALGWSPRTPLDEGLALTRAYYEPRAQHYLPR